MMKIVIETLFIMLLVIGVIFAICYVGVKLEYHFDSCIWNSGICSNCGGCFEFTNASTVKTAGSHHTYYFYACKSCGYIVKLSSIRYK